MGLPTTALGQANGIAGKACDPTTGPMQRVGSSDPMDHETVGGVQAIDTSYHFGPGKISMYRLPQVFRPVRRALRT
jgi:hypothetical protein